MVHIHEEVIEQTLEGKVKQLQQIAQIPQL